MFQTMETMPNGFVNDFYDELEGELNMLCRSIERIIHRHLSEEIDEDLPRTQLQTLLNCVAGSPKKEEIRKYLKKMGPAYDEYGVEHPRPPTPLLDILLRQYIHAVRERNYHRDSCHRPNEVKFQFLVEWDPTALKNRNPHQKCVHGKYTLLQELIEDSYLYPNETIKMVLKTGLKYFPSEMGLLLLTDEDNKSPFALAMEQSPDDVGPKMQNGWDVIEECLEEMEDLKIHEPDPATNLFPFMIAASDQSCTNVDLVYYYLRKDPSTLLPPFNSRKEILLEGTCRTGKRKRI
jgi:hypothetical protein